ncbi:MAG: beta-lactamase family protein [Gemmatimonadaceae bacterium]|nr:beta-lactamase family protein [Gemmatimonadaceae bacterium]
MLAAVAACAPSLHTPRLAAAGIAVDDTPASIRRLDGARISTATADSIARTLVERHHITGMQVAVVNDGRLAWSAAYGFLIRAPDSAMTTRSVLWAASITKAVFATHVMQRVAAGTLDLDQPIATLLPQPLDRYEPYAGKAALIVHDSAWGRVTPRMLLSHTSGLLNFANLEPDGKMRLHDTPGRAYRYSGEGFNLLQFVLEQRDGAPMERTLDSALLKPLGLARTALAYRAEFGPDMADRYGRDGQFIAKTRRNARAAGSLTTSAEDLAAFLIALMDDRAIPRRARDAMHRPQVHIRTLHQFDPPHSADSIPLGSTEAEQAGLAYGIGWGLLTRTKYGPAFFKEGHGDGANTFAICFPRRRDCMIILANSDNGEFAFRPLLESVLGNDVTPWTWEGYTELLLRAPTD